MPTFYVVRQANVVQIALGLGNLVLNVSGCDCKTSANQSLYASPRVSLQIDCHTIDRPLSYP